MSKAQDNEKKINKAEISVILGEPSNYARAMISEVLRNLGYQKIFSAKSAAEIIENCNVWHPNVIILENLLPDMPGVDLVSRIRRDLIVPDRAIPCIMLTNDPRLETVKQARQAGVDEFAAKPVSHKVVESRLNEVLFRPRPFIEAKNYTGPCRRRKRSLSYKGPLKRLNDPIQAVKTVDSSENMHRKMLESCAERMSTFSKTIDPKNRMEVRQLYNTASEANEIAKQLDDAALELATQCVARYIEGVGASGALQAAVIIAHVDAVRLLMSSLKSDLAERLEIANGLKTIVLQKLREAA